MIKHKQKGAVDEFALLSTFALVSICSLLIALAVCMNREGKKSEVVKAMEICKTLPKDEVIRCIEAVNKARN